MTPLLALMRPAVIVRPVDPDGSVVTDPLEVHQLRAGWRWAKITLHPASGGLWMWATCWQAGEGGGSYAVGEKWGRFTESRQAALDEAVEELIEKMQARAGGDPFAARAIAWARGLR